MSSELSPAKVLLLAVNLATHADISSLEALAGRHGDVLRDELLLRILLTYLPETVETERYVKIVQRISSGQTKTQNDTIIASEALQAMDETMAARKARKLHLLHLKSANTPAECEMDPISLFIIQRTHKVNSEAVMLSQIPSLLRPFLSRNSTIRTWILSTVFPFLRRSNQFYRPKGAEYSIMEFQNLPDRTAMKYLLSETEVGASDNEAVGRDLRSIAAPWLYNENRWHKCEDGENQDGSRARSFLCPGWIELLETVISWAGRSWAVAVAATTQWDGPRDAYFAEDDTLNLDEDKLRYLDRSFASAAIACVYAIPEADTEALEGAYEICQKVKKSMGGEIELETVSMFFSTPQKLPQVYTAATLRSAKTATQMRHNLLSPTNILTTPTSTSAELAAALVISAYIVTIFGVQWTVKKAGDLLFLGDAKEQKSELMKIIKSISNHAPKDNDDYWQRSRQMVLWLRDWGSGVSTDSDEAAAGPLGLVRKEHMETEILKALLSKSRYSVSKTIYEDGSDNPLRVKVLQEAIYQSALNAFDNASNPNRTRGGLKRCDEIIHSFPKTLDRSESSVKRIESLLKASHALSDYRLVLKQGEPFSPVVLRVHSDPIDIIGKVLEQNLKAYTRLQEFLEMGANMVKAGLMRSVETSSNVSLADKEGNDLQLAEKRIVAMCIEAALREDDFETAYSYVVSRLGVPIEITGDQSIGPVLDGWSWNAALKAGQYVRTGKSQQPTHLGTASGNLEIRHLEQRMECLATALRAAPASELQHVLKSFRRCEEQLDSAIREEAALEAEWDNSGAAENLPGTFEPQQVPRSHVSRNTTARSAARQGEEAPMSLFDLSRATARAAQKNFTALSSLQGAGVDASETISTNMGEPRARKRDQLRDAATGTLVSGVGWLIGANVSKGGADRD